MIGDRRVISIITPVYNVEPYIEQCLNSVLNQSFTDWEWILVDDGSMDRSLEILRRYAEKDHRIHVLTQKNQGPAAARNLALKQVKGNYITFLDSDDWMEPNAFLLISKAIEAHYPDMVMWNFKRYMGSGYKKGNYPMPTPGYHDTEKTHEYAADFIFEYKRRKGQYFPSCWIRAIKTEVIKDKGIRFNSKLKRTEDYMFLSEVHAYLNDMFIIDEALTVYRTNEKSITHNYTQGYMDMIDEIYDTIVKLPIKVPHKELVRRADLMYIYRAFVAIEQEISKKQSIPKKIAGIKMIMQKDRLSRCIRDNKVISKRVFGKRIVILQARLATLMLAYYRMKG